MVLLLALNWLIARQLFEPIRAITSQGEHAFETRQRRLTQLPLLTARGVGILAFVVSVVPAVDAALGRYHRPAAVQPTIADFITPCLVLTVFYFTYTYFVVSDYLAGLCTFIFRALRPRTSACSSAATR